METVTTKGKGVGLSEIIHEFNLEVLVASTNIEKIVIDSDDINRPGLQLAGFFDHFDAKNLQIVGRTEVTFLDRFTPERREAAFDNLFSRGIPALIYSRSIEPHPECLEMARKHDITVLRSPEWTSTLTSDMLTTLRVWLAPRVTRHGVLVEIYGEGILILGDSGIGKSETAIELVKRGHRLIADDAVEIKKVSNHTLVGAAPEVIRHYIELRGIGVIDVRRIFGMGAVKSTERIDLVVNLELWREGKLYDRMGMEQDTMEIMDITLPMLTIPVKPGRNLAVILEVAAMNNRDRKMGFNHANELVARMNDAFGN
ncbi:MAG: HPr(Ser) kinase/phosphatase [Ruminococcaceae bacterium]|nr:HPr(Ser) kinase/phosphatase [Oscillospiraceae bacterium]